MRGRDRFPFISELDDLVSQECVFGFTYYHPSNCDHVDVPSTKVPFDCPVRRVNGTMLFRHCSVSYAHLHRFTIRKGELGVHG